MRRGSIRLSMTNGSMYYIAYVERDTGKQCSELSQIYHPLEYSMAYWNKFQKTVDVLWWKELTPNEELIAVRSGGVALNLLK